MKYYVYIIILFFSFQSFSQDVDDYLNNGHIVKNEQAVFLKFDHTTKEMKYAIGKSYADASSPLHFKTLKDSSLFLNKTQSLNFYLLPLNPLSFSNSENITQIDDPLIVKAEEDLTIIISNLGNINKDFGERAEEVRGLKENEDDDSSLNKCKTHFEKWGKKIIETHKNLSTYTNSDTLANIFSSLKKLSFTGKEDTKSKIDNISKRIKTVNDSIKSYQEIIDRLRKFETIDNDCSNLFLTSLYKSSILNSVNDLSKLLQLYKSEFKNLKNANKMVKDYYDLVAFENGQQGLVWLESLKDISSKRDKISVYTIQIFNDGFKLSEDKKIVKEEKKEVKSVKLMVKRFQRFIPEVSVGTAFTFFNYDEYGTLSDSTGQVYIGEPVSKELRNLNISTMVNFNYYLSNSPIHPFYQIGVGVNEGIPTLLTGFGFRSVLGTSRLSISGGIAGTWIQELDELEVGDEVSGTQEIEDDLKYQFSWPPKPYIGLQYNF